MNQTARVTDLHQDMLRLAEAQAVSAKYARESLSDSLADLVEELADLTRTLTAQKEN